MIEYIMSGYVLLLSYSPCDIFTHYGVSQMHGLNVTDCMNHTNNDDQSYIAGWCNEIPNDTGYYVFINLSRCNDDVSTTALVFHEMMHLSGRLHQDDWENREEDMITFAENQTYTTVKIINQIKYGK
jgi:hypothetical protein